MIFLFPYFGPHDIVDLTFFKEADVYVRNETEPVDRRE